MSNENAPLKEVVKDLFADVGLAPEELAALRRLEQQQTEPGGNLSRRRFLAWAASVSAVTVTGGVAWKVYQDRAPIERMFSEVASVHLAKRPLNFQASNIAELSDEFAPQGFMVRNSQPLEQLSGELEGGRFCWLLKQAAAEFRYRLASGAWATVIQTEYKRDIFGKLPEIAHGKTPIVRFIKGLECWVWCDRGMVYAHARPA